MRSPARRRPGRPAVAGERTARGIPLRALAPNAVTALALCFGLSGVRFAIAEKWELAVMMIVIAGVLDGLDGRIARLLKGESRFGAELDSLSDVIAFGVSPAIVVYLWSLEQLPRYGWVFALAHAVCCALRLARFNANIDVAEQPHKSAGYFTGVPAPAGAGALLLPLYLWLATQDWWGYAGIFRSVYLVLPWTGLIAFLMVSNVATFSWSALRLRRGMRFGALVVVALVAGALITAPWETLAAATIVYLTAIPFGMRSYARVRRSRAVAASGMPAKGRNATPA